MISRRNSQLGPTGYFSFFRPLIFLAFRFAAPYNGWVGRVVASLPNPRRVRGNNRSLTITGKAPKIPPDRRQKRLLCDS